MELIPKHLTMGGTATEDQLNGALQKYAGANVPGLQYVVMRAGATLFECAAGWADIENRRPMTQDTTLMAYSMTKTFTAVAVLQLFEQGKLTLDDSMDLYLPNTPYRGRGIAIHHLLKHTAGLPNPIPLRWVHLAEDAENFNEDAALAQVLRENPRLKDDPGGKFSYSNVGYWLLGKIVEQASGRSYADYMIANILKRLHEPIPELDFIIRDLAHHANGYLAKYSLINLFKGLVTDRQLWGGYEGNWLRSRRHYVNGPSFGGLVGSARGFGCFLRDQLQSRSVLLGDATRRLLETRQTDSAGQPIPMTLGWHMGWADETAYLFKEGGGGGFHCEMRIYPGRDMASVVMANSTSFHSTQFLNRADRLFL